MAGDLNKVDTELNIAGAKTHFVSLRLDQSFNSHHFLEAEVNYEEMDEHWMESPAKLIGLIGEPVIVTMKHKQTGEENLFEGIITNVAMSGHHGQQNAIVISGKSPTIRLDGKETMDSFMDKTLKQIVDEAVANSGNGGEVTCNPVFGGKLDYSCQYNESCFAFLNRLSWMYGEWFFSDGKKIHFGKPGGGDVAEITYDKEMTSFNLSANLKPPVFNRYYYLHHDDMKIDQDAPGSVAGVEGYLQKSLDMSKGIYKSKANLPLVPDILTKKEQEDMVKVEQSRTVGEMLTLSGTTQTCKVKIGGKIKVKFPDTMEVSKKEVGTFTVTEVSHRVDQEGHYSNSFKGIMSGMENIPMDPCPAPVAGPQLAWVKSNADDKQLGRVKVEFQWQKQKGKTTNWIRVKSSDAGKSDKVPQNRGLVSIPEENDLVMVGFEYNDPDRPVVMGSIFSEKVSTGGQGTNKIKSYTTRVGSSVTFDDGTGSVTIKDKQGSDSTMTFDGEQNVVVHAQNTITFVCGKSIIVLDKDGTITINGTKVYTVASDAINISAGALEGDSCSGISIDPLNIGISAVSDLTEVATSVTLGGAGGKNVVALDGGGEITINGAKVNIN